MKIFLKILAALILSIALVLTLRYGGLEVTRFFAPREQSVQREVFEQTKSYVHGALQDIAKYYEEYQKADTIADKEIIANIIRSRFAEFDANNIKSATLRRWFIEVRGF